MMRINLLQDVRRRASNRRDLRVLRRRMLASAETRGKVLRRDRGAEIRRAERWALVGQVLVIVIAVVALMAAVAVIVEIQARVGR